MKLSGELDYRIRYDVEHDLFHAQNIFNDEYIKPTFVEYVQELEEANTELKEKLKHRNCLDCSNHSSNLRMRNLDLEKENAELKEKYNELSKAVFELKGEFMACPLDNMDRLSELIDRLNNL